jgi:hypothetical protein
MEDFCASFRARTPVLLTRFVKVTDTSVGDRLRIAAPAFPPTADIWVSGHLAGRHWRPKRLNASTPFAKAIEPGQAPLPALRKAARIDVGSHPAGGVGSARGAVPDINIFQCSAGAVQREWAGLNAGIRQSCPDGSD